MLSARRLEEILCNLIESEIYSHGTTYVHDKLICDCGVLEEEIAELGMDEILKDSEQPESVLNDGKVYLRIFDIEWDTDGEDGELDLPEEVIAPFEKKDTEDYGEAVTDFLSDTYGFCVRNCSITVCDS